MWRWHKSCSHAHELQADYIGFESMYTGIPKSLKRTNFMKHLDVIYTKGIGNTATMVSMRSMHVAAMVLPSCSVLVDGVGHVNPSGFRKWPNGHQKNASSIQ